MLLGLLALLCGFYFGALECQNWRQFGAYAPDSVHDARPESSWAGSWSLLAAWPFSRRLYYSCYQYSRAVGQTPQILTDLAHAGTDSPTFLMPLPCTGCRSDRRSRGRFPQFWRVFQEDHGPCPDPRPPLWQTRIYPSSVSCRCFEPIKNTFWLVILQSIKKTFIIRINEKWRCNYQIMIEESIVAADIERLPTLFKAEFTLTSFDNCVFILLICTWFRSCYYKNCENNWL